ncbi:MAG: ABC transporter permease, partial [Nitrospinae bacterium]|nr:ABC transporter permease [Nitrospinota bacterium]
MKGSKGIFREIKTCYAFIERDIKWSKKFLIWESTFVFYAMIHVLTIGYIGVASEDYSMVIYLIVGAMLWDFLSTLYETLADSVSYEWEEGTIESTLMAPIRIVTFLIGTSIYAIIYAVVEFFLLILVAVLFFNIDFESANIFSALFIMLLSTLSFIGLGMMGAGLPLLSPRKGREAGQVFIGFLFLISGIYYEVDILPVWMQSISVFSPATYALISIRTALLNNTSLSEMLPA